MRTQLLIFASTLSFSTIHAADACGVPDLQPFRLSSHYGKGNGSRTFVLLHEEAPKRRLKWSLIAPMSYDSTEIASAAPLASAQTFTLVGPAGARVVSSKKHVFLARTFDFDASTGALELDAAASESSIALAGEHQTAKWLELDAAPNDQATFDWVTAQGITPWNADSIYVGQLHGTDVQAISVFPKHGKKMITLLRRGDANLGQVTGSVTGAVVEYGMTSVVTVDGTRASTFLI